MKFVAALLISTVSAAAVADKASCATAGDTCTNTLSCCGTVTGTGAPATKICSTKPTTAEATTGASYVITAAVKEVKEVKEVKAVKASGTGATAVKEVKAVAAVKAVKAVVEVKGTFKCAAAGASYMTVGAAALVAAATLLQ